MTFKFLIGACVKIERIWIYIEKKKRRTILNIKMLFKTHTEARLRQKLANNELNWLADAILSLVLLGFSPFIWLFSKFHDTLMYRFLNKTYIYNVSWEVSIYICSATIYLFFF